MRRISYYMGLGPEVLYDLTGTLLNSSETQEDNGQGSPSSESAPIPLRSIRVVASHEAFIDDARGIITSEMENMVLSGLATLVCHFFAPYSPRSHILQNQTLLASSLQTAYNLGVLPNLVQSLLLDLSQAVEDRIRGTFDLNKISKDVSGKGMPSLHS